jgi:hypothetical protein
MNDLLVDLTNKPEEPASEMISPVNAISAELIQIRRLLEAYINTTLNSEQKQKLLAEFDRLQTIA